jgi:hypothetical protein
MPIAFTKRYVDRSLPVGYRFQFYCDRSSNFSLDLKDPALLKTTKKCSYSYLTTFQPSVTGAMAKVMQAANIFISSQRKDGLAAAGEAFNMVKRDKVWEDAFDKAVEEAKPNFRLCKRCKRWVCAQNCWDEESQQCSGCLLGLPTSEITLGKAQQFFSKVWENVQSAMEKGIDVKVSICPHCGERAFGGKFCPMCGGSIEKQVLVFCGHCGEQLDNDPNLKFCPNCGDALDYLQQR